ncbi:MAG TPA: 2-hydroxy-3-oxopropionate reductase, partial [Membranihabitans sp.]|nr:2-hydroxy-3-oxopropionate reductase [Membranihabitans sp.]
YKRIKINYYMEKIGFIGLGIMGKPMSTHILKGGHPLTVLKTSGEANSLESEGATLAGTPKELAEQCDVVITCLPDSPEVEDIVLGEDGVLAGMSAGKLYIDMSTIAPATAIQLNTILADKGVEALDAPVSGGEGGAKSASLSIMVGGTKSAFERALPILELMGKNIVRIGEAGAGQTAKACNQIIVGMTIQAVAEALTLAKKAGIDVARVREALLGGFAQSRILDLHGQRFLDGNFEPGFKVNLHRKDMNIALQTGRDLSVPLPGSSIVATQMDALIANGKGELDHSALGLLLSEMSDVK